MNQAQSSARKRLDEIFKGPYERLGSETITSEAKETKTQGPPRRLHLHHGRASQDRSLV